MKLPNFRDPKVKLAAGGAVAVGAFALYKSRSGAGAPASSTTAANPAGAASALGDANLQSAVYDSLESQYTGLNAKLSKLQKSVNVLNHRPASPKPPVTPKPPPSKTVKTPPPIPIAIERKRNDFLPPPLRK